MKTTLNVFSLSDGTLMALVHYPMTAVFELPIQGVSVFEAVRDLNALGCENARIASKDSESWGQILWGKRANPHVATARPYQVPDLQTFAK